MNGWVAWIARTLCKLGANEKNAPNEVSAARLVAYGWAAAALVAVFVPKTDHLNVAALIGGALTALGLRAKIQP